MNRSRRAATAFSPASVGNVAVGYDLLGHAIEGAGDRVTAVRKDTCGVVIEDISGIVSNLPREPESNTAGKAAMSLLQATAADFGVALTIEKGIPLGSGLGGSAASATAAVVAVNALLEQPLKASELYPHALIGEAVSSGSIHGDNVGPQLLGGLVLATASHVSSIPVPRGLHAAVVHPDFRIDTRSARRVLERPFSIETIVAQHSRLALVLTGCFKGEILLIQEGLDDVLVEPHRASLIPGFYDVKQAALDAGALGASISGAGPSIFAWCENRTRAEAAAASMAQAFSAHGRKATQYVTRVDAPGAHLVDE